MITYQLREATIQDLQEIVDIYNESVMTKQATADLTPVSIEQRQAWFFAHGLKKNRPLWVAVNSENQVIGWASLSNLYERPAYHISSEISVYIANHAKGQGIGQALIQHLLSLAPSCGIQQVVAKIFAHNQPSLILFTKMGFQQWGMLPKVCDMQTFIADVIILGKTIT